MLDNIHIFPKLWNGCISIIPGKCLKKQAQDHTLNLLYYFESERANGGPLSTLLAVSRDRNINSLNLNSVIFGKLLSYNSIIMNATQAVLSSIHCNCHVDIK